MRADGLLLLALAGCSLGNPDYTPCTASAECRDAFGLGYQCGSSGTCEPLALPARCTHTYPTDLFDRPEEHQGALIFGSLFDHGTDFDNLQSAELAFIEANIEGGLDGRELALVSCDYRAFTDYDNDPPGIAADVALRWLVDEVGVEAVIGPAASQLVLDVWDTASSSSTLLVSPSATSDQLTTIDGAVSTDDEPGLFWRTAPPDAAQVTAIVADLQQRGVTAIALIAQVGAYGDGLSGQLVPALGLPADRVFPYANPNQLTAAIADVAALDPLEEVVFISSAPEDVASFLNGAAVVAGYEDVSFFLTDTARDQTIMADASQASALLPRIRGTFPIPDPAVEAVETTFYLAYSQHFGEDANQDGYNAFAYDAAWLTLYGAAWALHQEDSITGIGIARGFRQVSAGPTLPLRASSWLTLQEAFAEGQSVDVRGASGELQFDPTTGETTNPIAIWTVSPELTFQNVAICDPSGCSPL